MKSLTGTLALMIVLAVAAQSMAQLNTWQITQLTNNSNYKAHDLYVNGRQISYNISFDPAKATGGMTARYSDPHYYDIDSGVITRIWNDGANGLSNDSDIMPLVGPDYVAWKRDGIRLYDRSSGQVNELLINGQKAELQAYRGNMIYASIDARSYAHNLITGQTTDIIPEIWNSEDTLVAGNRYAMIDRDAKTQGRDAELYIYDSVSGQLIVDLIADQRIEYADIRNAQISDDYLVFKARPDFGNVDTVYIHDFATNTTTSLLATDYYKYKPYNWYDPVIAGSKIGMLRSYHGNSWWEQEFFIYDIVTGDEITFAVTDYTSRNGAYAMINGMLVYADSDGHDLELFGYELATGETYQITSNTWDDKLQYGKQDGNILAWIAQPDPNGHGEIFFAEFSSAVPGPLAAFAVVPLFGAMMMRRRRRA